MTFDDTLKYRYMYVVMYKYTRIKKIKCATIWRKFLKNITIGNERDRINIKML